MQIKLLVSAAAIVLVAGLGAASAADRYFTMEGIEAQPMTPLEAAAVYGSFLRVVAPPGPTVPTGGPPGPPDPPTIADQLLGNDAPASATGLGVASNNVNNAVNAILP